MKTYRESYRLVILSPGIFPAGAKNLTSDWIEGRGFFLLTDGIVVKNEDFGTHRASNGDGIGMSVPSGHGSA
jgi:hypothetical protein